MNNRSLYFKFSKIINIRLIASVLRVYILTFIKMSKLNFNKCKKTFSTVILHAILVLLNSINDNILTGLFLLTVKTPYRNVDLLINIKSVFSYSSKRTSRLSEMLTI